jgi:aldose 1-epimerase
MSDLKKLLLSIIIVALGASCATDEREEPTMETTEGSRITKEPFGTTADGTTVDLYTLTNANGCEVTITNYGGIVVSLRVPDREGNLSDVVLGFDSFESYLGSHPHFGALVGRYGNRIGKAKFTLDGVEYTLAANNGENHLHGGLVGYDKVVWEAEVVEDDDGPALRLEYLSPDMDEGYPGSLSMEVLYRLTDDNDLRIDYRATTDKKTVVNLTHHSYFNLENGGASAVLGHELMIVADRFTPVDEGLIPTGELRSVEGTPMDFRQPVAIGARIDQEDEQLVYGRGYDHNWVLNNQDGTLALAARVYEPVTGRVIEVYTTEPGLQFYAGNFLDGSQVGKGGVAYEHRSGFCLETQHFPDSPNRPEFPSTVLEPGEVYTQKTIYKFSTKQ